MTAWQISFREGIAPLISTRALLALKRALAQDDPALIQGASTSPPPLQAVQDWPVEAACAVGYCGWQGEGLQTVGEVEDFFARVCFGADQALGELAGCRWFLNWFDETPRSQMRLALLAEIELALAGRESCRPPSVA
jgi:hypothetical protein